MLADVPENPTPTPPPDQRPLAPGLTIGAGQAGQQYAPPTESVTGRPGPFAAHEATDDGPYAGVIDQVHRTWSAALDEPSAQDASERGPDQDQPTPFHDDLTESTAVPRWTDTAASAGKRYGVPTDVALALIATTSKGDPAAQLAGGKAVGLAGVPLHNFAPDQDPTDPEANLDVAFGKLARLHRRTGDWDTAALLNFGAADPSGNPTDLGGGVDGFRYLAQFKAARRRYAGGT